MRHTRLIFVLLLAGMISGCVTTQKKSAAGGNESADSGKDREQTLRGKNFQPIPELAKVYFEFDSAELSDAARSTLAANAKWLRDHGSVETLLEGYCDNRGTDQYNLALGDRRAIASKRYLNTLGIKVKRMQTRSWGMEKPVCTEDTDPCWAQNRRVEFSARIPEPPVKKDKNKKK